jgi:hypothetical protein
MIYDLDSLLIQQAVGPPVWNVSLLKSLSCWQCIHIFAPETAWFVCICWLRESVFATSVTAFMT